MQHYLTIAIQCVWEDVSTVISSYYSAINALGFVNTMMLCMPFSCCLAVIVTAETEFGYKNTIALPLDHQLYNNTSILMSS